jgi:hypothetical protein
MARQFAQNAGKDFNMYKVIETITGIFSEEAEIERIKDSFGDDPDLASLLIDIVNLVVSNNFEEARGLIEILNGHSDNNPLEYLHRSIFDAVFYLGAIKFQKVK